MLFLLISENELFREIKRDGITSFHGIHVSLRLGKLEMSFEMLGSFGLTARCRTVCLAKKISVHINSL